MTRAIAKQSPQALVSLEDLQAQRQSLRPVEQPPALQQPMAQQAEQPDTQAVACSVLQPAAPMVSPVKAVQPMPPRNRGYAHVYARGKVKGWAIPVMLRNQSMDEIQIGGPGAQLLPGRVDANRRSVTQLRPIFHFDEMVGSGAFGVVVRRVERFDRRGTEPFEPFEFFQNRNFH